MPTQNATHYHNIRSQERDAIRARDRIEDCFSPEWKEAHAKARALGLQGIKEMERLAREDRQGDWAGPAEKELMLKGWL